MARIRIVKRTENRKRISPKSNVRVNFSKKLKTNGSSMSFGMMRKLEPVLKMPQTRRQITSSQPIALAALTKTGFQDRTIQQVSENTPSHVNKAVKPKAQVDVFVFPSSPKERNTEIQNTAKGEKETKPCLQRKINKKNKKKVNKEVLEIIRKARENIQLIRRDLQSYKSSEVLDINKPEVASTQRTQKTAKGKINVTVSVARDGGITRSQYTVEQSQSCVTDEEIGFSNGGMRNKSFISLL